MGNYCHGGLFLLRIHINMIRIILILLLVAPFASYAETATMSEVWTLKWNKSPEDNESDASFKYATTVIQNSKYRRIWIGKTNQHQFTPAGIGLPLGDQKVCFNLRGINSVGPGPFNGPVCIQIEIIKDQVQLALPSKTTGFELIRGRVQ